MRGHAAALLVQFARYKHWGNLLRLFAILPGYYAKVLLRGLILGFESRHRTYGAEVLGCLAGIKFYLQHRQADQTRQSCLMSDPIAIKANPKVF
jgi:hypothetical protein